MRDKSRVKRDMYTNKMKIPCRVCDKKMKRPN